MISGLERINKTCQKLGFEDSDIKTRFSLSALKKQKSPFASSVSVELRNVQESLLIDCLRRKFLIIPRELVCYLGAERLFGTHVSEQFPFACRDIAEAGNCLSVGCDTAAVFHLMRVAGVGLRALAIDRDLSVKNKPIADQEWGVILNSLEGEKLKELRNADRKNWTNQEMRDEQIRFYNEVVQELRSFNEAWRRHVSHAGADAFCDANQAISIFTHVQVLMQKLATKISENTTTAMFWTT